MRQLGRGRNDAGEAALRVREERGGWVQSFREKDKRVKAMEKRKGKTTKEADEEAPPSPWSILDICEAWFTSIMLLFFFFATTPPLHYSTLLTVSSIINRSFNPTKKEGIELLPHRA